MVALRPIAPELVQPEWADRVTAPAVDALSRDQLAGVAASQPWSFLHVTGVGPVGSAGSAGRDPAPAPLTHLERLRAAGAFHRMDEPGVVLYRLRGDGRARLGVVADLDLAGRLAGQLRRHESTEVAKVEALRRHRAQLRVDATPISVAYPALPALDARLSQLATSPPAVSTTTADGVHHQLWPITDPVAVSEIVGALAQLDAVYVLDGHHRLAAARHAAACAASGEPGTPARILTALFPSEQVHPLDYRRSVRRPADVAAADLLAGIHERFTVTPATDAEQARPERRGEMALRLDGGWYRLSPHPQIVPARVPERLDEAVIQRHLLEPLLGVADPRVSSAITYAPGTVPLAELEARSEPSDVLILLHPLPMAELQAVADAGAVLPPKSTYFTPKTAAGLLLQPRGAPLAAVP